MEFIREKAEKYKQLYFYIIFGVLTTLINIVSYALFMNIFKVNYLISNSISWVIAVLFAYVTNRIYVFESKVKGTRNVFYEMAGFISSRVFSGGIDTAFMYVFISILSYNDFYIKIISNVIVIILNYLLSKLFVFSKKK